MKFIKENGPHIKSDDNSSKIMTRVLIALIPIVCYAIFKNTILVYFFTSQSFFSSLHPLFMIITGVCVSLVSEVLWFKFVLKKSFNNSIKETKKSFSIIPGLLLSLVLPTNVPLWVVAFGAFCGTIVGKMLYGGFGQNVFNPALIGYLFISVSYNSLLGSPLNAYELDALAGATPLTNLTSLGYYGVYDSVVGSYGSLLNFFTGTIPGAIGEVSKLLILVGFLYLAITKTIKWRIPITYILTVFILTAIIGYGIGLGLWYPLFHVLSGGLLFGAVFMATDPVTSPVTQIGQVLHGISLGILTVAIRFLTPYPEGVMTSILFMNMLVPLFDKIGVKLKYAFKKIYIPIIIYLILVVVLVLTIISNVNNNKNNNIDDVGNKVTITETKKDGNKTTYIVTSKGWGVIKAEVEVVDKEIKSIIVTDKTGETQWSEIEKENYIYKVITNQKDINNLDAVSGSTFSSNALKNIVKKVLSEELK